MHSFIRRFFCALFMGLLTILPAGATTAAPNVVFILVDDMGWTGPACFGSELHETPNIDRLAAEGMRFTNAYSASPVCTPTRAALLTGKHPARLNMTIWREAAVERLASPGDKPLAPPYTEANLDLAYATLGEQFQEAGYSTLHVGKWHLGDAEHYPETHGFDVNIGATVWGAPYSYWYPYHGLRTLRDGTLEHRYVPGLAFGTEGEYLTDRLTTEAINALARVKDQPFFLHMSYHAPHTPIEAKPELEAYYKTKIREGMNHTNARYAALVHVLDQNVGRLLAKLEEWRIAENTVVIFYSDNGGFGEVRDGEAVTGNTPLRSAKGSAYEGGIRVPLIIKWPGKTAPGTVCDVPVTTMDFYPTLLEGIGASPALAAAGPLDGVSILPLLEDAKSVLQRDALYWHYPHYYFNTTPVSAVRQGPWKLVAYYEDGRQELYNLAEDLGESTDLARDKPEERERLHGLLEAWRNEVNAQRPTKNTPN